MGILKDWMAKPVQTNNRQVMDNLVNGFATIKKNQLKKDKEGAEKEMKKEEMMEELMNESTEEMEMNQEAVFEEVEEKEKEELSMDNGVLVFKDSNGDMRYQYVGDVSLENMTYYSRYLSELEKSLWAKQLAGELNA